MKKIRIKSLYLFDLPSSILYSIMPFSLSLYIFSSCLNSFYSPPFIPLRLGLQEVDFILSLPQHARVSMQHARVSIICSIRTSTRPDLTPYLHCIILAERYTACNTAVFRPVFSIFKSSRELHGCQHPRVDFKLLASSTFSLYSLLIFEKSTSNFDY